MVLRIQHLNLENLPEQKISQIRKGLKSGEALECLLVFSLSPQDQAPLMSYSADAGGAITHDGGKWFLLR